MSNVGDDYIAPAPGQPESVFWQDHRRDLWNPEYREAFIKATGELTGFEPMFGWVTFKILWGVDGQRAEVIDMGGDLMEAIGDRDVVFEGLEEFTVPDTYDLNVMLSGYLEDGAAFVTIL